MTILLLVGAIALTSLSGLAAAALRRRPAAAQGLACAMLCAGAALAIATSVCVLVLGEAAAPWLSLRVDALSAVFLLPVALLGSVGAVYGLRYFPQATHGVRAVRLQIFYGLTVGGMSLLVAASSSVLFLVGWEAMALASFFVVHTDHDKPEVQRAAFLYLAASHVGTLALFAMFALLRRAAGSFDFTAVQGLRADGLLGARVFALALLGFGVKAGLMPVHFWLPPAHAAAPSHVSALMSGVVVKMGVYGILRITGLLDLLPAWWGWTVLFLGAVSAVLGVAFALAQHDVKRLLAYHTVENVGIIALGAGLALLGRARGEPALVMLGFGGAALHVVNHALFKGLLFLGAGAVHHATGTRDLDHLGGLARTMRFTAALFLIGAAAIAGLPPLNGFVSEWLVYLGFLHGVASPRGSSLAFVALGAPVLALVGGLAAACFAKVFGIAFLGSARSAHAQQAHEAPRSMLGAMAVLAASCVAIGLAPAAAVGPLRTAAAAWAHVDPALLADTAVSAGRSGLEISLVAAALVALTAAIAVVRRRRLAAHPPARTDVETWGCGFAAPTARMQYTGSSFAEPLVALFSWVMFPRVERTPVDGPFPAASSFRSEVPDTVVDLALAPAARSVEWVATLVRVLYARRVQFQMLLVVATLVAALALGFVW